MGAPPLWFPLLERSAYDGALHCRCFLTNERRRILTRRPQLDLFGRPISDPDSNGGEAKRPASAGAQRGPRAPTRPSARPTAPIAAGREEAGAGASGEILAVGELASLIKGTLERSFRDVLVRGEISNLRQPGSGHLYFSLKDERGSLRAVLFRGQARLLRFQPTNGQEVLARGRVGFYEVSGDAQIVCESLEPLGAGALALAFEQRKAALAREGLFAQERKRRLPFLPRRIGVVTSPTGAAIHDFVRVLHRRFPRIEVLIAPARVQGEGAAEEIAAGIERLGRRGDCQVIVVTRGGGSLEDLWAFNEEIVARAIAASPIPVVSAVGHEVDFTIADFVADLRAPTPTGAAELLAPVEAELRVGLGIARSRLTNAVLRGVEGRRGRTHRLLAGLGDPSWKVADARLKVEGRRQRKAEAWRAAAKGRRSHLRILQERLRLVHPELKLKIQGRKLRALQARLHELGRRLFGHRREHLLLLSRELAAQRPDRRIALEARRLGDLRSRLGGAARRGIDQRRARVEERVAELRALSPLRVLARGYSIAFQESGAVLYDASSASPGDRLHLEVAEGALEVEVVAAAPSKK